MPPASPLATRVRRIVSSSDVLPWSTWPITVTTGGRGSSFAAVRLLRFGEQRIRIVELRRLRLVAHFLDHDHRRLLVEHLVDRHHRAELHQRLDDLGGLHRHLVRELGDGDRLRNRDVADDRAAQRPRRRLAAFLVVTARRRPSAAASRSRPAPPVTSPRSLSARRRAASSWNTGPALFLAGVRACSPGLAAGRCSVPSVGAFARGRRRRLRGGLPRPSAASAAAAACGVGRGLRGGFLGFASPSWSCASTSCSCFFCTSSCWRAISSWPFFASASRAASSSA